MAAFLRAGFGGDGSALFRAGFGEFGSTWDLGPRDDDLPSFFCRLRSCTSSNSATIRGSTRSTMAAGIQIRSVACGSGGGFGTRDFFFGSPSSSSSSPSSLQGLPSMAGRLPLIPCSARMASCRGAISSRYSLSLSVETWCRSLCILTMRGCSSRPPRRLTCGELISSREKCFAIIVDGVP